MDGIQIETADKTATLALPGVLDMKAGVPLKDALLEAGNLSETIVVDAGAVSRLSTPCIQILLSAQRTLSGRGKTFILRAPSPDFVSAFDDLGLFPELMQWKIEQ